MIIDHLTPPLTRAESYGPLRELERLVDEYSEAAGVDPRRLRVLADEIVSLMRITGLDIDCGIGVDEEAAGALAKLDRYLCELKEMQIRDGLHVFGAAPEGAQLRDLLVALARTPRGPGERDASLIRALADDLGLGFDPLSADLADPWTGARPPVLEGDDAWRTAGDTVERLEALAAALVGGERPCQPEWTRTRAVLDEIEQRLRPAVVALRRERIARAAERPRRPVRRARALRRADARPARRAADRAQLLFRRHPRPCRRRPPGHSAGSRRAC